MELSSYERYGLHGNPFSSSDKNVSLQALEIYHVTQVVDDELALLKEGAFNRENKAVVMLVGQPGMGKTHRLLLASREAELNTIFCVYYDIGNGHQVAAEGLAQVFLAKKHKRFSQPPWMKSLQKIGKGIGRGYDPGVVGASLAEALNMQAPAFLLLNGFHKLPGVGDGDRFLTMLTVLFDRIRPGVLVLMECDAQFFSRLVHSNQGFASRITKQVKVPVMSDDEARLLLAKRLLVKRMVEDVDPLYPFTQDAVSIINERAHGVPVVLLQQAKMVFDDATQRRVITIDDGYVRELFRLTYGEEVDEVLAAEQPDLEVVDEPDDTVRAVPEKQFTPVHARKPVKPMKNPVQKRGRKPQGRNPSPVRGVTPVVPRPVRPAANPEEPLGRDASFDDVVDDEPVAPAGVKEINNLPLDEPEESEEVEESYSKMDVPDEINADSWKPMDASSEPVSAEEPVVAKKSRRSVLPSALPKLRRHSTGSDQVSSVAKQPSYEARIQCPECSKVFVMTIYPSTKKIQCPFCQFRGKIGQ